MGAIYNEFDEYAARWIDNLITAQHIAPGTVDTRSIAALNPEDVRHATQAHFFAGIAVWSAALRCAGWPDDVPVWTGSCPCQPFSQAGRAAGFDDERHLWPEWFRLIRECHPPVIFGEQVASPAGLGWLDAVFADLEGAGYACAAADLCAASVGAPHQRQRTYFLAITRGQRRKQIGALLHGRASGSQAKGLEQRSVHSRTGHVDGFWKKARRIPHIDGRDRLIESSTLPLAHGAPARVGRLRAYGNAIVRPQAQAFIETVMRLI